MTVSLHELRTCWTLADIERAHQALDALEEAEELAAHRAERDSK